jgi:dipeptidase E
MSGVRLYLSSYQFGHHPDVFSRMVRGGRRGWVISNALDAVDVESRETETRRQIDELAKLGLRAAELDLRLHGPDTIAEAFDKPDFIWVRGGNVFVLRAALARSGADDLIARGIEQDAFVYGAFSAGVCVLAPRLEGLELCDPVEDCIALYGTIRWDGLGVLDRAVVPHLASPSHPESAILQEVAELYDQATTPYWALRDGDVLIREGDAHRHLTSKDA